MSRTIVALTAAGLLLGACSEAALPAVVRPPAPVLLTTAEARDVPIYLDEIGRCAAREMVSVQPQVTGRITEVLFEDGADLKVGDPLFSIDARPYQARLDAAKAVLEETHARLDWARLDDERVQSLSDTRAVSQSDADLRRNAVAVAQAQLGAAEAEVLEAQLDLEYCSIRSPIEGRAGQRLVDPGNVVKENEGSLLVIQRLDPLYADFTVAENDLSAVQRNMATGALAVEVRLPDEDDSPRSGELTFLDNAVQGGTGTLRLRATFPNGDRRFWPGRFVRVRLLLETLRGAVLVPAGAPQLSATGSFLYVVGADDTAQMRPVTLGQRQGEQVVIESGLAAGERVVAEGQLGVTPGGKVNALPAPTPPAPAPPADVRAQ